MYINGIFFLMSNKSAFTLCKEFQASLASESIMVLGVSRNTAVLGIAHDKTSSLQNWWRWPDLILAPDATAPRLSLAERGAVCSRVLYASSSSVATWLRRLATVQQQHRQSSRR